MLTKQHAEQSSTHAADNAGWLRCGASSNMVRDTVSTDYANQADTKCGETCTWQYCVRLIQLRDTRLQLLRCGGNAGRLHDAHLLAAPTQLGQFLERQLVLAAVE